MYCTCWQTYQCTGREAKKKKAGIRVFLSACSSVAVVYSVVNALSESCVVLCALQHRSRSCAVFTTEHDRYRIWQKLCCFAADLETSPKMLLAENVALSIPKDVGLQEGENEKTKIRIQATFPTGSLLVPLQPLGLETCTSSSLHPQDSDRPSTVLVA